MGEAISLLHRGAVARYGDLGLSASEFGARVLAIRPGEDARAAAGTIHSEDLYLATACAAGIEQAWVILDEEYRSTVFGWCRSLLRPNHYAQDLAELVWTSLCLPGRDGRPRIGSYEGACALGTWLHTIAGRRAINFRNQVCRVVEEVRQPLVTGESSAFDRIEARRSEQRLGPPLIRSLEAACGDLSESDGRLLVWRFEQDLALGEIARRLGVHQSTVTRRIERVCGRIRRQIARRLASEFHLDRAAVGECFRFACAGGLREVELFALVNGVKKPPENGYPRRLDSAGRGICEKYEFKNY